MTSTAQRIPAHLPILRPVTSPAATRFYINTQWPVIGGRHTHLEPTTCWDDPDIARHFQHGTRISVGVLACPGLYALSRRLQIPTYKISTTTDESAGFLNRIRALNADSYGGVWRDGNDWRRDTGYDAWELCSLPTDLGLSDGSPVTAGHRAISVILPESISPRRFDELLRTRFHDASLNHWIRTSAGTSHLAELGELPEAFCRHTAYNMGGTEPRHSAAGEIYIFKPRLQTARLACVIEQILVGHIRSMKT